MHKNSIEILENKNKNVLTSIFTHNRLGIEPEFFKVSLVEKFVRNSFGQKVLLFPRFSNSAYITGCHQHSTENCKRYKKICQMLYIPIGAILTWATGPWNRLLFCPAPKIHSTKYIFLAKNSKSPKWDRLILVRNGALGDV